MDELTVSVRVDVIEPGVARLHYSDGSTTQPPVTVPTDEIQRLIDIAEMDYYVALPTDPKEREALLRSDGCRLYRFLDTSERRLSGIIDRTYGEWDRLVLLLATGAGMAHLPWELLHDGVDFVAAAPRPILPVRQVPGRSTPRPAQSRPLRLMFMACAPLDAGEPLDYDTEQAQIWSATRRQSIDLRVEESGDLDELRNRLLDHPEGYFDAVHLTGHARHTAGGPRFLTEGPRGEVIEADAADIQHGVANRAAVIFLSGCRTAEASDAGAVRSLAQELARIGVPTVLGWGRAVPDPAATEAAARLYQALAQGLSPVHALAETYRTLIRRGVPDWHLLRMFVRGDPPMPLVTAASARRHDTVRRSGRPGRGALDPPDPRRFVGRRREVQRVLRSLDPRGEADRVGLIVYGMAGVGKTTLVRRVRERLGEDYQQVWLRDYLDQDSLLGAIAADPDLADILAAINPEQELSRRLGGFLRRAPRLLFVLDEFEINFRPDRLTADQIVLDQGRPVTRPEAVRTLTALVEAINSGAGEFAHRIVLTSRYLPAIDCVREFELMELHELPEADVDRLIDRLRAADELSAREVERIREHANSNPRLLEWLFTVARANIDLDQDALDQRLRARRVDFLETDVFAAMLLDKQDQPSRALLGAAEPFRLPVPAAVLARLTGMSLAGTESRLRRLAGLGLVQSYTAAGPPARYRVPLVLEQRLSESDPARERDRHAACAAALAAELGAFLEEPDARRLDRPALTEVHRLAREGHADKLAVDTAVALADIELCSLRFEDAARVCETMLDLRAEHRLYQRLALAHSELGRAAEADVFLDKALAACPADQPRDRAAILACIGFEAGGRNPGYRGEQLEEAIALARQHGRPGTLATALRTLARIVDERGDVQGRKRADDLLAEAASVAGDIADGGIELANVRYDRALVLHLGRGEFEAAQAELAQVLAVYERLGLGMHQAVALLEMAVAWISHGVTGEAERLALRAVALNRSLRSARIETFADQVLGDIAIAQGEAALAAEHYQLALERASEIGNLRYQADSLERLGRAYRRLGEVERAAEAFRAAEELHTNLRSPRRRLDVRLAAIEEDRAAGDVPPARMIQQAREAATLAGTLGLADREARALSVLAEQAERESAPAVPDIDDRLRRLVELTRAEAEPARVSLALYRLGRQLVRSDRPAEAEPYLRESLAIDEELGATQDQAVLHALLASAASGLGRTAHADAHLCRAVRLWLAGDQPLPAVTALRELAAVRSATAPTAARDLLLDARALARSVPAGRVESQVLGDLAELARRQREPRQALDWQAQSAAAALRGHPLRVHVGLDIVPCFDPELGAVALAEISRVRDELLAGQGWTLPAVTIVDDTALPPRGYAVYLWGEEALRGTLPTETAIAAAVGPDGAVRTREPGFDQPIWWVEQDPHALALTCGAVVAGNLRHLAIVHRAQLDAGEPQPPLAPGIEARTATRILADLADLPAATTD